MVTTLASLRLYSVYHLNLAYSSIDEKRRPEVIRRCYWPLLELAERGAPLGIECTGFTLETIQRLDPSWVERLRDLVGRGRCEFIGSGWTQIIGPLVPAEVNRRNQLLGRADYTRLGFEPDIALINEQAWSPGLVEHYIEAGYRALIMEWDNPSRNHPDWDAEWRYCPQRACGHGDSSIPLLWNQSIAFQKFQRYAHGELSLGELGSFLDGHRSGQPRCFSLYGNDAEVFDFRPGRFQTEPALEDAEWERIGRLYEELGRREGIELVLPGEALDEDWDARAGHALNLESAQEPIPVKKQGKYNVSRWALTGREDLAINTDCHAIHRVLRESDRHDGPSGPHGNDWRELCWLWSSDLRTHITPDRWRDACERRRQLRTRVGLAAEPKPGHLCRVARNAEDSVLPAGVRLRSERQRLHIESEAWSLVLNTRRGLAVDRFAPPAGGTAWIGTIPHGYFSDIRWGADFYTGHLVFEGAGQPKVTDLEALRPVVGYDEDSDTIEVSGRIETALGPVHKRLSIDRTRARIRFDLTLDWSERPMGRLRLGHVTLNPEGFDRDGLRFRTHNGGHRAESHALRGIEIDHADAVSFLVSSNQLLGMTEGGAELGDGRRCVRVQVDPTVSALHGMVTLRDVGGSWFCRLSLSAQEMDDTSRGAGVVPSGRVDVRYWVDCSG